MKKINNDLLMLNNQNSRKEYFSIDYNIDNQHLIDLNLNHLMLMLEEDEQSILLIRMNTFS
jgi:hypothetical protein